MVNVSVNKQFIEIIPRKSLANSHLNKTIKVNNPSDIIFFPLCLSLFARHKYEIHNSWEEEPVALKVYKHMYHYYNIST